MLARILSKAKMGSGLVLRYRSKGRSKQRWGPKMGSGLALQKRWGRKDGVEKMGSKRWGRKDGVRYCITT